MNTALLEETAAPAFLTLVKPLSKKKIKLFSGFSPPKSSLKVSVIVPAKNEAETLSNTLDALRTQLNENFEPLDADIYEVILLINNTTDDSYKIADAYKNAYPSFNLFVEQTELKGNHANIGRARGLLMDEAFKRLLKTKYKKGIIASTDSDTIVDCQWIHYIIKEIESGIDAVGGRIITLKSDGKARLSYLRNITFRCLLAHAEDIIDPQPHDPSPRHYQYFGANMAVTTHMYKLAGRLPQVPNLEDMAFHDALLRHDAKIRRSYKVKVYTSDRTEGKVRFGFSQQLRSWLNQEKKKKPQLVEDISLVFNRFRIKKRMRNCWNEYAQTKQINTEDLIYITALSKSPQKWIKAKFLEASYFGQLWAEIDQKLNKNPATRLRPQPIGEAIVQLRNFIKTSSNLS